MSTIEEFLDLEAARLLFQTKGENDEEEVRGCALSFI